MFVVQVSIVKSEETKVRQEDLSKLLYEVQLLRTQQDNMECQMQDMKQWVKTFCYLKTVIQQKLFKVPTVNLVYCQNPQTSSCLWLTKQTRTHFIAKNSFI